MNARLYYWQRMTAGLMVPLIAVHLVTMIYAIGNGLSAAEILGRTQGSLIWGLFYGGFVVAASVHAAIGVRTVIGEWFGLRGKVQNAFAVIFCVVLLGLGGRAVVAVVM
ncbi:MAG: succinate dehydrogenase [Hyphomicrobiales bacterium]|nr:succinate dehydrogenase [Hyphomicrobiales bacterium]